MSISLALVLGSLPSVGFIYMAGEEKAFTWVYIGHASLN